MRFREKSGQKGNSSGPDDRKYPTRENPAWDSILGGRSAPPPLRQPSQPAATREGSSLNHETVYSKVGNAADDLPYPRASSTRGLAPYQEKLVSGRVKICVGCGNMMAKSTRMVMSPVAGLLLILLGAAFMAAYGLATNFYPTPWFAKFALPAVYYIGSIFVGVGLLFFFIREKVWKCRKCGEIRKR